MEGEGGERGFWKGQRIGEGRGIEKDVGNDADFLD